MNQEITRTGRSVLTHEFTVLLSPTRRGARLARLLTTAHLGCWGLPTDSAAHIVAELAVNATIHGRVPGRDFRLSLRVRDETLLRIEVSDARGEHLPPAPGTTGTVAEDAESGRGLLIVEALADRWGVTPGPVPRKTVWAELDLAP
ncbi:ATP-binding protein [Streptomyces sp. DT24]|uniref:ATP-binding protein n=1 Tax=unclassified Streptomyces TaxID=2593676 RepID=UPI0023B8EBC3|nr:ATP-binding protein [Streptomyces sp. AM 4-1-1]WEH35382.1 ATP-binding protein [Streptomyces sp. AM 4-1-1]